MQVTNAEISWYRSVQGNGNLNYMVTPTPQSDGSMALQIALEPRSQAQFILKAAIRKEALVGSQMEFHISGSYLGDASCTKSTVITEGSINENLGHQIEATLDPNYKYPLIPKKYLPGETVSYVLSFRNDGNSPEDEIIYLKDTLDPRFDASKATISEVRINGRPVYRKPQGANDPNESCYIVKQNGSEIAITVYMKNGLSLRGGEFGFVILNATLVSDPEAFKKEGCSLVPNSAATMFSKEGVWYHYRTDPDICVERVSNERECRIDLCCWVTCIVLVVILVLFLFLIRRRRKSSE
jgi:hypothetical protein